MNKHLKVGGGGRWGSKPEYPQKTSDKQSENCNHIIIRGENLLLQLGFKPSPSKTGDQFASSERAGSNPLK